jgi:hypothetical protein
MDLVGALCLVRPGCPLGLIAVWAQQRLTRMNVIIFRVITYGGLMPSHCEVRCGCLAALATLPRCRWTYTASIEVEQLTNAGARNRRSR